MPGFAPPRGRDRALRARRPGAADRAEPARAASAASRSSTQPAPYVVAGCPFVPPAAGPCVTAQWVDGRDAGAGGRACRLLLQDSVAVCAPTGTPCQVVVTQMRVKARPDAGSTSPTASTRAGAPPATTTTSTSAT